MLIYLTLALKGLKGLGTYRVKKSKVHENFRMNIKNFQKKKTYLHVASYRLILTNYLFEFAWVLNMIILLKVK